MRYHRIDGIRHPFGGAWSNCGGGEGRVLKTVAKFVRDLFLSWTTWDCVGQVLIMGSSAFFGKLVVLCSADGMDGVVEVVF